ncbi:MAG: OmpA family protein, partial [Flavobacteriales bacterium]|nr:OmpA family protein [Flavobacteriales bacterium]
VHVAITGKVFEVEDSSKVGSMEEMIDFHSKSQEDDMKYKPLASATVSLYLIDKDNPEEPLLIKTDTTGDAGEYFLMMERGNNYQVVINKEGYFNRSFDLSTHNINRSDTIQRNAGVAPIPPEPIIIKNIYYPFDKYYLTDSAKTTIDTTIYVIMKENPNIIAEISSHTDSHGTDKYNERLSQKRAESVVKYLIEKGIKESRLVAKGYGESKPIAPNEKEDGSDDPEGRAKNRRTEFKVIGRIDNISGIIYED